MLFVALLFGCQTPADTASPDSGDSGEAVECPEGFSGADCSFCTLTSAGAECQPSVPADLFDLDTIQAMSLTDLGWEPGADAEDDGVLVKVGDIETPFAGVTSDGEDMDVTMRSKVAAYFPSGWPDKVPEAARGKALVYAAHYEGSVESGVAAAIARGLGMPVFYHGEYNSNFTQLGYADKGELNRASGGHMRARNECEPTGFVRGNYQRFMAEVDMRVITLAQRLAEERGGELDQFALRGFSKEGAAGWLALAVDDRIVVGGVGGSPKEDLRAYSLNQIEQIGCDGSWITGETAEGAVWSLEWYEQTPAGALYLHQLDINLNQSELKPRFIIIDGDTYQPGSHDGDNYILGAEDTFLDELSTVPWRYSRLSGAPAGGYGDAGDTTTTTVIPYLVAEALYREDDPAGWYPKVLSADASITGGELNVSGQVDGSPETVSVFVSYSDDRSWSEKGQAPWVEFELTPSGEGWSTTIDLTSLGIQDKVIGWYVEGRNTLMVGDNEYARKDASPIRFLQEPAAGDCSTVEPADFCGQQ